MTNNSENADNDSGTAVKVTATSHAPGSSENPIVIKKYANRRLYNTDTSSYITLETLHLMVRDDVVFIVCDARTGEDITRSVLTQIILEEEAKGTQTLLPISFLRQLIGFYGDQFHHLTLPNYLESAMQAFQQNQAQFRKLTDSSMGNMFPMANLEHLQRQNMAWLQQAMSMFNPIVGKTPNNMAPMAAPVDTTASINQANMANHKTNDQADDARHADQAAAASQLDDLQAQLAELKNEIRKMKK